MSVGETFTWLRRSTLLGRIERQTWERIAIACLFGAAILFPIAHRNDGDIDAAANALTFAALALGLNIVVGLAGLLDLGYAAFFAIGAYTYGAAASWQITPEWSSFWEPFQWLGLVAHYQGAGEDVVHFQVSFWLMMPIAAVVASGAITWRSSHWVSARSCPSSPATRRASPMARWG
jgi:ABC-type branched-subunit amino acid transport system permease subunit